MALRRDGTVVEWGTLDRDALLDARGVTDAVAIAAGDGMSVALQRDGSVVCWGPRVGSARAAVRQLPPIRLIGCAQQTIVAIDQADTLHVIGAAQPVAPTRLDGATALALTDTLIAVAAASGVWVVDATGARPLSVQSAHGTRITRAATPQRIAIQQLVHRLAPPIAAGYEHTVAIAADGYALSWGDNTYGQRTAPAQALVAVAAGGWHALGYDRDGRIHAWGRSNHGQTLFATVNKFRAVGIAAGMVHSIAVGDDGRVLAWGNNDAGQCSVPALAGAGVAVAAGMRHSVVLLDDGTVQAWGNNSAGQTTVPADLRDVVAVAAGGQSSAALRADGTLVVWGELAARAGGVTGLRDITAVTLGGEHGAVLLRDGRIECFGNDDYGQCHPGRALPPIAAIACGTLHTVALSTTGELFAWGRDSYQQTHIPAGVVFRR
jgi:alpha-tubulin suppressor-like RCC1 family protein